MYRSDKDSSASYALGCDAMPTGRCSAIFSKFNRALEISPCIAISDGRSLARAVPELEVVALCHRVRFSELFKNRPR